MYSNPQTGGLKPDDIVEADHHLPTAKETTASPSPTKDQLWSQITIDENADLPMPPAIQLAGETAASKEAPK